MRNLKKISILVMIAVIIGPILYFINEMWGNPVSKVVAKHKTKDYLEDHYELQNLRIDYVVYNFKMNAYSAYVVSDTSMDIHFSVYVSKLGKVLGDSYDDVVSGWNTYSRLEDRYRDMVDTVMKNQNLSVNSDINFGTIKLREKDEYSEVTNIEFGIEMSSLEIDKQYDMNELGSSAGHIIYYVVDQDVSIEKACEILLGVKEAFDEDKVPFYAIDFVLREGDEKPAMDGARIHIKEFLYTELYPENLKERVQLAHDQLSASYAEKDALKDVEMKNTN